MEAREADVVKGGGSGSGGGGADSVGAWQAAADRQALDVVYGDEWGFS